MQLSRSAPADEKPQSWQSALVLALAFGCLLRAICWSTRPRDLDLFLEPWFNHIVRYGPVAAFGHPFSNYEPAYLYLLALGSVAHNLLMALTIVKILSVAGTVFLTFAMVDILKAVDAEPREALFVLALPSVAINDALLAQCDALWAGSCIFALAAIIRGRSLRSAVWCGVAIAFKLQSAFMAPVIIGAMAGRRAPMWHWFVPMLVFLASLVPAWLQGWPMPSLLTVYIHQADFDQFTGRLANPWMIGTMYADEAAHGLFLLGYLAAAAAAVLIASLAARVSTNGRQLMLLGALSGTLIPFLLPKMLERYYYLGDVMTLALALSWKCRSTVLAFWSVQLASLLSLVTYIYFYWQPYPALAGAASAAVGAGVMLRLAEPDVKALVTSINSMWPMRKQVG